MHSSHGNRSDISKRAKSARCCSESYTAWTSTFAVTGLFDSLDPEAELQEPEAHLAASAVSGHSPPAGPQWRRGLSPLRAAPLGYDKPLTLHAATRAGALDPTGREKLLCYWSEAMAFARGRKATRDMLDHYLCLNRGRPRRERHPRGLHGSRARRGYRPHRRAIEPNNRAGVSLGRYACWRYHDSARSAEHGNETSPSRNGTNML